MIPGQSKIQNPKSKIRSVLAIDPGRAKCGLAVVDEGLRVHYRAVVLTEELPTVIPALCSRFSPLTIIIGDGTGSAPVRAAVNGLSVECPVRSVVESRTSEAARARYVSEIPARGFRRLLPRSLRTPETPYDDFVAVILAERWWAESRE
jgi:hypothetical protein